MDLQRFVIFVAAAFFLSVRIAYAQKNWQSKPTQRSETGILQAAVIVLPL